VHHQTLNPDNKVKLLKVTHKMDLVSHQLWIPPPLPVHLKKTYFPNIKTD
jgi:hypothetical protein